ncbi:pyridoxal-phosphate-dependent aminotransferase family protein [Roseibium aggregatum]|uniref:Alanine--glyoxylate aminotransferase family protein n=1 Tax=Roseibium aggregatum TaxID=187304 RepID=A0A939J671_9HYPH|nr:alanine--glyoxylate aminotransferase family protein [Roseibium aggregatum]MBN9672975.1 alanine--glyoxylate aminotransferase family protein [Roseibium aggregatum]
MQIPNRLLMGPGPSNVTPDVLDALSQPTIGHLDPVFQSLMEEVKDLLRYAFQTSNAMTFPISAPASLAMEAALVNLIEPGDTALIVQNGVFGGRMADIAARAGANVVLLAFDWGTPICLETVERAIRQYPQARLLSFVHAETSTGVRSDAASLCKLAHDAGILSVVDTVTGLGGVPVAVDDWQADVVYSGTQKCLSVPPGLAPITFSEKAVQGIRSRKTKVQSWFMDLNLVLGYWSGEGGRSYHHTAPVNAIYGLARGLADLKAEGLEASWERHRRMHLRLAEGLRNLGLDFLVEEEHRLPQLNTVVVPADINEAFVRSKLLMDQGIEIGAGLGTLAGKVWRIGLMGHTARAENVDRLIGALEEALAEARRRAVA